MINLMLLLLSCETTRVEYIRDVPEVSFPIFPEVYNEIYDFRMRTVTVPLDWYAAISVYKVDVDAVEEYLNRLRAEAEIENAEVRK